MEHYQGNAYLKDKKYCFCCKEHKYKYQFQSEIKGLRQFKYWCLICIAKLMRNRGIYQ